jgi:hypothetical protein
MNPHPEEKASLPTSTPLASQPTNLCEPVQPFAPTMLDTEHTALVPAPATPSAMAPAVSFKTRTRCGKIARLPTVMRDLVNRMLRDAVPYEKIVNALDEAGLTVTERNVSNWKTRGGYREWCLAQDHAVALHVHQDNLISLLRKENATDVSEVGLQTVATRLSQFFLTPQADELLAANPQEYHRRVAELNRVNAELLRLQKYRDECARNLGGKHDPERIRREDEEEFEHIRKSFSSTRQTDANGRERSIPPRNYLPKKP